MRYGCCLRWFAATSVAGGLGFVGGCAQPPIDLIPDGPRSVLEHEVQFASSEHQSISVSQLLAQARGEPDAVTAGPDVSNASAAESSPVPASNDAASSGATGGQGFAAGGDGRPLPAPDDGSVVVSLAPADQGADPDRTYDVDRLRAVVDRLPPSIAWRTYVSIGPAASGDPIVNLADAQRRARALVRSLPQRLQPVQLRYRPDLPANTLRVEFRPGEPAGDG